MEENIFNAALAGLLRDIGKFALRSCERDIRQWDNDDKRDFGYYHALLTREPFLLFQPGLMSGGALLQIGWPVWWFVFISIKRTLNKWQKDSPLVWQSEGIISENYVYFQKEKIINGFKSAFKII